MSGDSRIPVIKLFRSPMSRRLAIGVAVCSLLAIALSAAVVPSLATAWLLQYDALNYFLMAESVARGGTSVARYAVNTPPSYYIPGPGYVYAPVMAVFQEFSARLRAVQAVNLALFAVYLALSVRYLVKGLPQGIRWIGIMLFCIAAACRGSVVTAILLPNADLLPALGCVLSFLLVANPRLSDGRKFLLLAVLGGVLFWIKMTVLVFPAVFILLVIGKRLRSQPGGEGWTPIVLGVLAIGIFLALFADHWLAYVRMIAGYYIWAPNIPVWKAVTVSLLNLFLGALPEAIIPNFQYLYFSDLHIDTFSVSSHMLSSRALLGIPSGLLISTAIVFGAFRLLRLRSYELLCLAMVLPAFALAANSTTRYLVGFHPLIWVCFMSSAASILVWARQRKVFLYAGSAMLCLVLGVTANSFVTLRSKNRGSLERPSGLFASFADTAMVAKGVSVLLGQAADDGAFLIQVDAPHYHSAVWSAVTGIPGFSARDASASEIRAHKLVLVLACRPPWCGEIPEARHAVQLKLKAACLGLLELHRWEASTARAEAWAVFPKTGCSVHG